MLIADYQKPWEHLSRDHETKDREVQKVLNDYRRDEPVKYMAYAILGTYGVGKTHFLYHIHRYALGNDMLPLYFIAEDLFREIISERDRTWTPGELYSLVEDKISKIKNLMASGSVSEIPKIIDPRGKISKDSPDVMSSILTKLSSPMLANPKLILLVDELEGQYGNLQKIVQTLDRSPLREWLESKTHLKFLAFAPAGIYELGGADRDRVKRVVIPSADVKYVRSNLINDVGKSNACWWLSRGKARQLFKAVEVLKTKDVEYFQDSSKASRLIKDELDAIGQPPTEVPPAVTDKTLPSKVPYLLKLEPVACGTGRRYVIDADKLQTGELANRIIDAFHVNKSNAILISEYFKKTVLALSDINWLTYVDEKDLPELFCLVLDHFLEYEHGNPEISKTFGEIMGLYERSKDEHAAMHGTIGTLWERRETESGLPLTIEEIRGAFPFPTMNPIVKDYVPDETKRKWEGKDTPLWRWGDGNVTNLFFGSARDFVEYAKTDEFLSMIVPDGKGVLCLLPFEEGLKKADIKPLFKWSEANGKLRVVRLPHLLTDFLLSASGEVSSIPGDLLEVLNNFKANKEDILLSRKVEIYERALENTVMDESPKPLVICRGSPPDADTVWGRTQIARNIAVSGVALAFEIIKPEERNLLADLRELFRGGREGRGLGDLRYLISSRDAPGKGGHTRLPDRLLPYRARGAGIKNTENIEKLKVYWNSEAINKITDLARILPLAEFVKLHQDEDISRLLEALWRTTREEFEAEDLAGYIVKLEQGIIPPLQACQDLENKGTQFGLQGIDFGQYTNLVKSLPGFKKLLELTRTADDTSPIIKSIFSILLETTSDIDDDIRNLDNLCSSAKRALEELNTSAEQLRQNIWEYKKAVKFSGLVQETIKEMIGEQMKMNGIPELEDVETTAQEAKGCLDNMSDSLSELEKRLSDINDVFTLMSKGGK
jgi:hypothetical protein